uniref:Uncharacterized protein n=1 Tax=Anguilla anguilla TaxID=7936 RepID=A0A0E9X496_ANGAN
MWSVCTAVSRPLLCCPTPDSIGAIPYLYPRAAVLLFVSWYYPVVFVIAQYVDFGDALAGNCTGSGRANPWTAATLERKIDFQICNFKKNKIKLPHRLIIFLKTREAKSVLIHSC